MIFVGCIFVFLLQLVAALIPGAAVVATSSFGLLGAMLLSVGVGASVNALIGVPFACLDESVLGRRC